MKQIDLKNLSLWHIDVIGAAVCVAMTLALYSMSIRPLLDEGDLLDARKAELKTQQAKADKLAATRIGVGEQLAEVQKSMTEAKLDFLPASQVNKRISAISTLAAQSGLKIDDIQPGKPVSGSRYEMIPITVSGKGTYAKCLGFLHELRSVLPDTGVSALELAGRPSEESGEADYRFELLWYAAPRSS